MFITEPDHESLLPGMLNTAGSRHWRMMTIPLHAPWFVLSIEVSDGDVRFVRTACVAWDTDLADLLESLGDAKAVGLLCMVPGWNSPTGSWWAREVREVWIAKSSQGVRVVTFRDEHGTKFGDQRGTGLDGLVEPRLLLNLGPGRGTQEDAPRFEYGNENPSTDKELDS